MVSEGVTLSGEASSEKSNPGSRSYPVIVDYLGCLDIQHLQRSSDTHLETTSP
jgi:hypothetical protein